MSINIPDDVKEKVSDAVDKTESAALEVASKAQSIVKEVVQEKIKVDWKFTIIGCLVFFIIGCGATFYLTHNYYEKKISELNTKLSDYEVKYASSEAEREKAIIAKALADEKANTPVKEYIKGETQTVVQYVEKTSSSDADASLTSKDPKFAFEYNGEKYSLDSTTKNGTKIVDGKLVINQESAVTLDVTDIVNRQIADTINKDKKEKAVLSRQKVQGTFWGFVAGVGIGKLVD